MFPDDEAFSSMQQGFDQHSRLGGLSKESLDWHNRHVATQGKSEPKSVSRISEWLGPLSSGHTSRARLDEASLD